MPDYTPKGYEPYTPKGFEPVDEKQQSSPEMSALASFGYGAGQGATLGFGEEASAGLGALLQKMTTNDPQSLGELYHQYLASDRGDLERARQNKKSYIGGELVGALPGAIASGGTGLAKGGLEGAIKLGGAYGGLSGAGHSDVDLTNANMSANERNKFWDETLGSAELGAEVPLGISGATSAARGVANTLRAGFTNALPRATGQALENVATRQGVPEERLLEAGNQINESRAIAEAPVPVRNYISKGLSYEELGSENPTIKEAIKHAYNWDNLRAGQAQDLPKIIEKLHYWNQISRNSSDAISRKTASEMEDALLQDLKSYGNLREGTSASGAEDALSLYNAAGQKAFGKPQISPEVAASREANTVVGGTAPEGTAASGLDESILPKILQNEAPTVKPTSWVQNREQLAKSGLARTGPAAPRSPEEDVFSQEIRKAISEDPQVKTSRAIDQLLPAREEYGSAMRAKILRDDYIRGNSARAYQSEGLLDKGKFLSDIHPGSVKGKELESLFAGRPPEDREAFRQLSLVAENLDRPALPAFIVSKLGVNNASSTVPILRKILTYRRLPELLKDPVVLQDFRSLMNMNDNVAPSMVQQLVGRLNSSVTEDQAFPWLRPQESRQ